MSKGVYNRGKYYEIAKDIFKRFGSGEFVPIETQAARHVRPMIYRGYIKPIGERGRKKTYQLTQDAIQIMCKMESDGGEHA